jgi:hypothetical protein
MNTIDHKLKTDPDVFQAMIDGKKTYELRKGDRGFAVGDTLTLQETRYAGWEMHNNHPLPNRPLEYTGRSVVKVVTHILVGPVYGLADGWVILSCK